MDRGPLTDRAWLAVRRALEEAARQGRPVASSHLLLGVLAEGENLGRLVLDDLGVDAGTLERSLRRLWEEGPAEPEGEAALLPRRWWARPSPTSSLLRLLGLSLPEPPGEGPLFTADGRAALEGASRECEQALRLFIATEHLLLALAREPTGRAGRALEHFGATPRRIQDALALRLPG